MQSRFRRAFAAGAPSQNLAVMHREDRMRVAARTLGRTAMFAVALSPLLLSGGTAVADDSAAHALADKFSRAEDAERAAAEKKAEGLAD